MVWERHTSLWLKFRVRKRRLGAAAAATETGVDAPSAPSPSQPAEGEDGGLIAAMNDAVAWAVAEVAIENDAAATAAAAAAGAATAGSEGRYNPAEGTLWRVKRDQILINRISEYRSDWIPS